jgi:NAD(P)-dependent dehydrogenase (short-subunit alcohol dehydrogenase family)
LKRERVIITGSEGLIGSSVAGHLAKTHKVLKLSRRFSHDLTDEGFVKKWFAANKAEYLVNCYGLSDPVLAGNKRGSLFDVSLEDISKFLSVNVVSLFSVCREFARNKEAKAIVNLSSIYGLVSPAPELYRNGEKHIGYSISKAAVIQLTRHLAVHLAPRVRVNCVAPGGIRHKQGKDFIKRYGEKTLLGRMMEKDELNGIIGFLCSNQASYMTGVVVVVDGGWTAL